MKRFTETTKWQDKWFRQLPARLKCLWSYLLDNCDAVGVIDPDWELVAFQVGENVSDEDIKYFAERIQILPNGKLWITRFVEFQYGKLSRDCKAHIPVFKAIQLHRLDTLFNGDSKAIHSLKETDKDKDKEKEKDNEGVQGEEVPDVLLTESQAVASANNSGVPPDFAKWVYPDWHDRGGKDAAGVTVKWSGYVKKRWNREQQEWNAGTHRGKQKGKYGKAQRTEADRDRDRTGLETTAGTGLRTL